MGDYEVHESVIGVGTARYSQCSRNFQHAVGFHGNRSDGVAFKEGHQPSNSSYGTKFGAASLGIPFIECPTITCMHVAEV